MVREGTLFSWEWGGGLVGLGNFGIFLLALPGALIKKTPDPPPISD